MKKDIENIQNILQQIHCVLEDLTYTVESYWVKANLISAIDKIAKDISQLKSE